MVPMSRHDERKTKSRIAAKNRRSNENMAFTQLCRYIPLARKDTSQLDKASIIKLAVSFFKTRNLMKRICRGSTFERSSIRHGGCEYNLPTVWQFLSHTFQEMGKFLCVTETSGNILYVSESVTSMLGTCQADMIGSNLYCYIHDLDSHIFAAITEPSKYFNPSSLDMTRRAVVRMRVSMIKTGTNVKTTSYRMTSFEGRLMESDPLSPKQSIFIAVGELQRQEQPQSERQPAPLSPTFSGDDDRTLIRTDMALKILEFSACSLLGALLYPTAAVASLTIVPGSTMYDIVHPEDLHIIHSCHCSILSNNNCCNNQLMRIGFNIGMQGSESRFAWFNVEISVRKSSTCQTNQQIIFSMEFIEEENTHTWISQDQTMSSPMQWISEAPLQRLPVAEYQEIVQNQSCMISTHSIQQRSLCLDQHQSNNQQAMDNSMCLEPFFDYCTPIIQLSDCDRTLSMFTTAQHNPSLILDQYNDESIIYQQIEDPLYIQSYPASSSPFLQTSPDNINVDAIQSQHAFNSRIESHHQQFSMTEIR